MPVRRAAKLAAVAYIGLFALGIFSNFFVLERLTGSGDAIATVENIAGSAGLFRAGIVGFLAIFVLDVFIAWLLHVLFRPVNGGLSLLAAWLRLVYTVFLGVATVFLVVALRLVETPAAGFSLEQSASKVMSVLDAFTITWLIGLLMFGLHLALLGYLMVKSQYMPRLIGIILLVAGTTYVFDTVANLAFSNYEAYENVFLAIVAVPSIVAELTFTIWLLTRAGRPIKTA